MTLEIDITGYDPREVMAITMDLFPKKEIKVGANYIILKWDVKANERASLKIALIGKTKTRLKVKDL